MTTDGTYMWTYTTTYPTMASTVSLCSPVIIWDGEFAKEEPKVTMYQVWVADRRSYEVERLGQAAGMTEAEAAMQVEVPERWKKLVTKKRAALIFQVVGSFAPLEIQEVELVKEE